MHALNILALLLPLVAAEAFRCNCKSMKKFKVGHPNMHLTEYVCRYYFRDTATYNDGLDECVTTPGNTIDEMLWEEDCKHAAEDKC
ncbi:uncharacterized protein CPUR_02928 [Claviceps purpurea 20.1]|uniref:Uncharacterized protein n=1 Tax=Claviceps purpurea (strain 20.1) TaxID=1111077 RepID=M1W4D8_CLAP2|nr:uncharacterized protein CPUR_02928 [Claviceps purpurea 20.1]